MPCQSSSFCTYKQETSAKDTNNIFFYFDDCTDIDTEWMCKHNATPYKTFGIV